MKTALLILLLVAALAGAVLYWRYRTSPNGTWKHRLLARVRELQKRQAALRNESERLKHALDRLASEAFHRHLQTIPVERLADFPNIGPATITRLQDAGYRRLADVVNAKFVDVAGIGEARGKDLVLAVKALVKDAQSRFDAGACPEAQEYRRQVDALRLAERDRDEARARELAAVEAALAAAFDLYPLARAVSFWGFLLRRDVPGLTPEIMSRPLPEPMLLPPVALPVVHPPAPPAVPPVAATVAARPTHQPFALPPSPPVAPVPPPPADLFHAELNTPAKPAQSAPAEHPGLARLRAVVGLGFVVAKADGRVAQAERKAIRAFLEQSFGHDPVLLRNIDPLMERTEKAVPGEESALAAVRVAVPAAERAAVYQWAERIADASGERNQKERDALARIAAALELSSSVPVPVPEPVPAVPPSAPLRVAAKHEPAPDPRAILDIAPDVPLDADLIRRRYQMLTDKLDPARAAAFGPEFARMAEEKRGRVRAAAEALIAPFNEPLEKPTPPPPADLRHNPDLDDVFGA